MSLESQVAALVSAASNLTSQVAGKMSQIDQKVNQATQSVPDTIRNMAEIQVYVDAIEGDDTHDGTPDYPLKTLKAALIKHMTGSKLDVLLREGQTFAEDGTLADRVSSGIIEVMRWGSTSGVNNPVVKNTAIFSSGHNSNRGKMLAMDSGVVIIHQVDLDVRDANNGEILNTLDGLFYTYQSSLVVFFNKCRINLFNRPLFGTSQGGRTALDVRFNDCTLDIEANDNGYSKVILGRSSVFSLGVGGVTLPQGMKWSDLVPVNTDFGNIITNLPTDSL
ncbi:hypothetical protein DK37_02440 [Halomonas sp. SUBG004]|nr:hypothetical protein DK37_02440 [Halomonas sp. SUBG004]